MYLGWEALLEEDHQVYLGWEALLEEVYLGWEALLEEDHQGKWLRPFVFKQYGNPVEIYVLLYRKTCSLTLTPAGVMPLVTVPVLKMTSFTVESNVLDLLMTFEEWYRTETGSGPKQTRMRTWNRNQSKMVPMAPSTTVDGK